MGWALAAIVVGMAVLPASAHAQGASSSFAQLTGADGCVTQEPPLGAGDEALEGCARARGLLSAYSVAASPDDKHVYVASSGADTAGTCTSPPTAPTASPGSRATPPPARSPLPAA